MKTINYPQLVNATTELQANGLTGLNVDWWIILTVNNTWYYLNPSMQWTTTTTPYYQGPFSDQLASSLFYGSLSPAAYVLYFGVDTKMNGVLDLDHTLFYDSATLQVN